RLTIADQAGVGAPRRTMDVSPYGDTSDSRLIVEEGELLLHDFSLAVIVALIDIVFRYVDGHPNPCDLLKVRLQFRKALVLKAVRLGADGVQKTARSDLASNTDEIVRIPSQHVVVVEDQNGVRAV